MERGVVCHRDIAACRQVVVADASLSARCPATATSVAASSTRDRKSSVRVAVGIGTFMSALDDRKVNTILPVIRDALGTDVATVEWVVTVSLLVVGALTSLVR